MTDPYSKVFLSPTERESLVAEAGRRLSTEMATLSLIGLRHQFVLASAHVPLADWNNGLLPLDRSLCSIVARTGQPLVLENGVADPSYRDHPAIRMLGLKAYLGVPVRRGQGVIAVLAGMDRLPLRFSREAVSALEALAERAAYPVT